MRESCSGQWGYLNSSLGLLSKDYPLHSAFLSQYNQISLTKILYRKPQQGGVGQEAVGVFTGLSLHTQCCPKQGYADGMSTGDAPITPLLQAVFAIRCIVTCTPRALARCILRSTIHSHIRPRHNDYND